MYQHRAEEARFDCVDLDPYGSAVPFLDAAMNAIADGGACLILPFPLLTQSGLRGVSCRLAEQRLLLGLNLRAHRLDVCYVYGYGRPRRSQLSGKGVSLPPSLLSSLFVSLRRLTRVRVHVQLHALRRRLRQRRVLSRSRTPFFFFLKPFHCGLTREMYLTNRLLRGGGSGSRVFDSSCTRSRRPRLGTAGTSNRNCRSRSISTCACSSA